MTIKFQPGTIVCTLGASEAAPRSELLAMVNRHLRGDWGDVCEDDAKANDDALKWGNRVMSSYTSTSGEKLWVLTEAGREQTTVLTPHEY